jgi:hypothetical protein
LAYFRNGSPFKFLSFNGHSSTFWVEVPTVSCHESSLNVFRFLASDSAAASWPTTLLPYRQHVASLASSYVRRVKCVDVLLCMGACNSCSEEIMHCTPYHVIVRAHSFIHNHPLNVEASLPVFRSLNLTETSLKPFHSTNLTQMYLLISLPISMFFVRLRLKCDGTR